jgi:RNA polymerase sigma-70 factor (ECF subfamily)
LAPVHREVAICLRRRAASHQELMDHVHDVLLALLERDGRELRRWDPSRGRSLESFVRLVARRRVARTLGRRGLHVADDTTHACEPGDHGWEKRLEARRCLDRLFTALAVDMHPRDEQLFELVFVQELEPAAVAARLGMTRLAVNAWTYRRRKQARDLLADAA